MNQTGVFYMDLIVPYLGRNNWKGKDILLYRDILKTNHLHRAIVCYGYKDQNGRYQYLTQVEAQQNGLTVERVEYEAMANLLYMDQTDETEWVPILTESNGEQTTILSKTGSDITASNILRQDILRDLQHYFETPTIAIAVPNRNTVLACSKASQMLDYFKRKYQESVTHGYEPVSDMIYLARGGALIGAAPFPGTEDYVDKSVEDVHTVSLSKVNSNTTSTRINLQRSSSSTQKRAAASKRPKTKFSMEAPKKKVTFKLK